MMATIIEVGDGSFIAGDPDTILAPPNHWCDWCRGDGLDSDFDGLLCVCGNCVGVGQLECDDATCDQHRTASK